MAAFGIEREANGSVVQLLDHALDDALRDRFVVELCHRATQAQLLKSTFTFVNARDITKNMGLAHKEGQEFPLARPGRSMLAVK